VQGKKPVKKMKRSIYSFSQLLVRLFLRLFFGCRYSYEQEIPTAGPLIVASNHASYFDPPSVGAGIPREDIHFMAKRELFRNPIFGALISFYHAVPIRRSGMDWKGIARIKNILGQGGAIILFPEGTRQKEGKLGKARFGLGMLAQETGAPILPVYSRGTGRLLDAFLRRRPMRILYGRIIQPEEYAGFDPTPRGQLAISKMALERISALKEKCETSDEDKK
jgi:1-acyl-sn-glycerol-3-phosphate acyltransferase